METKDNTKKKSQYDASKGVKINKWPLAGESAADILKTNYCVLIEAALVETIGFQIFYQEWMKNIEYGKKKTLCVPLVKENGLSDHVVHADVKMLNYYNCDGYVSFFNHIRNCGTGIFLVKNESKINNIISAAKEAGIYVRIYGLDEEGRLRNYKISTGVPKHKFENGLSQQEVFEISDKMASIRKTARKKRCIYEQGDVVYTSNHQLIRLKEEFISNSQSITYQTDQYGIQAKIYDESWLAVSYFEDKAKKMIEKNIQCEGICWPIDLLYNEVNEFVGLMLPAAEGHQLKQELMSQQGLEKNFPNWNRYSLTHLVKVILDKIVYLQDRNILFGLVNPAAIFVKDENHVYFVEMDTYQIEGYPILSYERIMQAPELQDVGEEIRLYSKAQDNYEIALLVFMILMPGKFPYNKGNNKNISDSIKKMNFAFRYGKNGTEEHGAREYFGLWRFAWSHLGNDLKQAFYNTFQRNQMFSIPEKRRDARFWQKKVGALEQELRNPYDKESLRIFPRTFKRFSGAKTIRCTTCGIEHPVFYYKYPEKKICNSCLGKPSDTHFECRSCGKDFYYDFGTLFKYEKLVETKDFRMPTHCPYCRADKRKCKCCGEMIPAYRINENGICIDCAKREREQISKRYLCRNCDREIVLTKGEVEFHMQKFGRLPQYCKQCREERRNKL